MSSKEVRDVEGALDALKTVAKSLHVPFDTSELERAVKALLAAHPRPVPVKVEEKK